MSQQSFLGGRPSIQTKKGFGDLSGFLSQLREWFFNASRNDRSNVGQMHRLIALGLGLGVQVSRHEVRGIGLDHQSVGRDAWHQLLEMTPAALITDPSCNANVAIQVQQTVGWHDRR